MIPDDWRVINLGEVGTVKMCKRVMKEQTSEYGEIPFYKIGTFGKSPDAFISKKLYTYLKENYSFPKKGDVLISAAGTIGRTVIYDGKDAFFQDSNIVWLDNDETVISNKYLYYLYQIVQWKTENGGVVSRLYNDIFNSTKVPLPPTMEEQRKIAKVLGNIDNTINALEKLIEKKKNIKQAAMQQLLTPKSDWETKNFKEIFDILPNNTITRENLNEEEGLYQDIHYGDILIKYPEILDCSKEKIPYVNKNVEINYSKYGVKDGDIIIADTAEDETVGKAVEIYNIGAKKLVAGLHTFLCRRITGDFSPKYLGYFMNHAVFHNQLLPFITGTKVSSISRETQKKSL